MSLAQVVWFVYVPFKLSDAAPEFAVLSEMLATIKVAPVQLVAVVVALERPDALL